MTKQQIKPGDYVLATKYSDGRSNDHWCLGFYDRQCERGRHYVVDHKGQQFRPGGFRRVARISRKRGDYILRRGVEYIEQGSRSLWWWKRCKMEDVDDTA